MAGDVLALIPAKYRSVGVPMKNWRPLCGVAPATRAQQCALAVPEVGLIVVSTEAPEAPWNVQHARLRHLQRPPAFAQDDTPMLAVVRHALEAIPGPPDQIIVLLQPTQPLRQPKHVQAAIRLLRENPKDDSVVSVVELPKTLSPEMLCRVGDGHLVPWAWLDTTDYIRAGAWSLLPKRRQDARTAYQRDGTVYAFRRKTVDETKNFYGHHVRPLIIPPEETCPLDTPEDWAEAERRLSR